MSQPTNSTTDFKPLISGEGLGYSFADQVLFKEINFKIFEGEHVVLIGPSGHGKSLLLKLMAGLLEPQTGRLYFMEKNWSELSITQRNSHYLMRGMLFQKNALFDSLSVLENALFPLLETETSYSDVEKKDRVEFLLNAVGLWHAKDLYPKELSGGMQKRLGIARALVLKPKILLCDDPVAGLDPITARNIVKLIQEMQSQNQTTCVSILNDMNRTKELATRILMVMDQKVVDLGSPQEALENQNKKYFQFLRGEPYDAN